MSGQQTPRRWGLGNPAEETICCPNTVLIRKDHSVSKKNSRKRSFILRYLQRQSCASVQFRHASDVSVPKRRNVTVSKPTRSHLIGNYFGKSARSRKAGDPTRN